MPLSNKGWDETSACSRDLRPQSGCRLVLTWARATELLKASTRVVDKSQFGFGQYVWVHPQTYAIVEGSAVRNEGVIAKVADMMDGKLVISIEGDMEKRLIDCDKGVYKKLKPGFQISVLPPTMEVLEVLPNL